MTHNELVAFAHQLADASATKILPHFRSNLLVESKAEGAKFDPVTEGDRAAEHEIRRLITAHYPEHSILGEEHGITTGESNYRWVIDPIDGTRAFVVGLTTWGTLIGLEVDDKPSIGLMNQPYTGDRLWSDGEASYFRDRDGGNRTLHTRQTVDLAQAQMACTHPDMFKGKGETAAFHRVSENVRSCRYGTDCYGFAMLAAGLFDVVVEASLQPYDIVALIPIIENAGGVITTWDGGDPRHGGRIVASANAALHEEVRRLLAHNSSEQA